MCYKCDSQAYTGNMFIIHLLKEHSLGNEKILICEGCNLSCTKEKELENHRSSEHVKVKSAESISLMILKKTAEDISVY